MKLTNELTGEPISCQELIGNRNDPKMCIKNATTKVERVTHSDGTTIEMPVCTTHAKKYR